MSPTFGACAVAGHTAAARITSHRITLLETCRDPFRVSVACLLLRDRSNQRQHDGFALKGLYQHNEPQYEKGKPDQGREEQQSPEMHDTQNELEPKCDHDPGHIHENRLECVETDRRILVVRCQHQKDNAGDQADQVAQCRSHIVSHRARYLRGGTGRGGRRRPYLTPAFGTKTSFYRGTARRAKRHLCSSYPTLMCTTPDGKYERDIRRSMSRGTEHKLRNQCPGGGAGPKRRGSRSEKKKKQK